MTKRNAALRDLIYNTVTANHLTESFTYQGFQDADISEYIWEPFEDWPINQLESHIAAIADTLYGHLKD